MFLPCWIFQNLDQILGASGVLIQKIDTSEINVNSVLLLKILCNFTHCPGEKDWSCISRDLIETFTLRFITTLENNLHSDPNNQSLLKVIILSTFFVLLISDFHHFKRF